MTAPQFVLAYLAVGVVVYVLARYHVRREPDSAALDNPQVSIVALVIWPLMLVLMARESFDNWRTRRILRRLLRETKRIVKDADRPDMEVRIDALIDKVNQS